MSAVFPLHLGLVLEDIELTVLLQDLVHLVVEDLVLGQLKGMSWIFSSFSWLSHFALFPNSGGISKMEDLDGSGK